MQKRTVLTRLIGLMLTIALAAPATAVDSVSSTDKPDLSAPRSRIKAKDWAGAITELRKIAETSTHADVYSLLGFALRNAGNIAEARMYYAKALDFDPAHKGAHEYLGELYLKVNDTAKAREQLAILEKLCPNGCEELDDLRRSFTEATVARGMSTN